MNPGEIVLSVIAALWSARLARTPSIGAKLEILRERRVSARVPAIVGRECEVRPYQGWAKV